MSFGVTQLASIQLATFSMVSSSGYANVLKAFESGLDSRFRSLSVRLALSDGGLTPANQADRHGPDPRDRLDRKLAGYRKPSCT